MPMSVRQLSKCLARAYATFSSLAFLKFAPGGKLTRGCKLLGTTAGRFQSLCSVHEECTSAPVKKTFLWSSRKDDWKAVPIVLRMIIFPGLLTDVMHAAARSESVQCSGRNISSWISSHKRL